MDCRGFGSIISFHIFRILLEINFSQNHKYLTINYLNTSCGWGDSNPHAVRHQILSLGCLPISTHPQNPVEGKTSQDTNNFLKLLSRGRFGGLLFTTGEADEALDMLGVGVAFEIEDCEGVVEGGDETFVILGLSTAPLDL